MPQESPREAQESSRETQESSKRAPRELQKEPKTGQESPRQARVPGRTQDKLRKHPESKKQESSPTQLHQRTSEPRVASAGVAKRLQLLYSLSGPSLRTSASLSRRETLPVTATRPQKAKCCVFRTPTPHNHANQEKVNCTDV